MAIMVDLNLSESQTQNTPVPIQQCLSVELQGLHKRIKLKAENRSEELKELPLVNGAFTKCKATIC